MAWYDSLVIWRETGAGHEAPETDGFVGGRYHGRLSADGRYQSDRSPFVPDDLAAAADLAGALDEFLPRVAPTELAVGRVWRDSTGWEIRRLDDGRQGGERVQRFRWTWTRRLSERHAAGDSLAVRLEQQSQERGELSWSDAAGPVAWQRTVRVNAHVPAREGVTRSITTVVNQEIEVLRLPDHPACARIRSRGSGPGLERNEP